MQLRKSEELISVFKDYKEALAKIEDRRAAWTKQAKEIIMGVLKFVSKEFGGSWHIQNLNQTTNQQTINLSTGLSQSGISSREINEDNGGSLKIKNYLKENAYVAFIQLYSGYVKVIISYPSIKGLVSKIDIKEVCVINPSDITKDWVFEQVTNFVNELIVWESAKADKQIGFNNG
jgi:hypothetical protein